MANEGLIKKVTSDLGTEGGEGVSREDIEKEPSGQREQLVQRP